MLPKIFIRNFTDLKEQCKDLIYETVDVQKLVKITSNQKSDVKKINFKKYAEKWGKILLSYYKISNLKIFRYSYLMKNSKLIINTNDQALKNSEQFSKVIKKFHTLLVYDWIHENLYFNSNNSIYVIGPINFKQNSFNYQKILSHLFEIRSLAISPTYKLIFWLDIAFGTIESANLDGTERRILVQDLFHAQALTIGMIFTENALPAL